MRLIYDCHCAMQLITEKANDTKMELSDLGPDPSGLNETFILALISAELRARVEAGLVETVSVRLQYQIQILKLDQKSA